MVHANLSRMTERLEFGTPERPRHSASDRLPKTALVQQWNAAGARPQSAGLLEAQDMPWAQMLNARHQIYDVDCDLIQSGQRATHAYILETGWACSHDSLASGARQILSIFLPGDFIEFPLTGAAQSSERLARRNVSTLSAVTASKIEAAQLSEALTRSTEFASDVVRRHLRASSLLEERLIGIGRRSAVERVAHFYLELSERLNAGKSGGLSRYTCPLSQYVVADALGLSAEHVNRVLKQLRLSGLLRITRGWVELLKPGDLVQLADFDPAYLQIPGNSRA